MEYGIVGILFIGGLAFGAIAVVLARLLQNHRPYPDKLTTYECGMEPQGTAWVGFRISYFLYALVFLVFDVETIFLYPWAVSFQKLGLFAIVEMCIFLGILIIGFLYAWKEGAFEWL
ncbi:NADH dehydrogenase subunit A [Desulfonispora thiosulfatigenes DSM 11270]|uniref:NADH-quinone oxidoreductase subunit A n=2 Tax=Desulfonispora thiosulfatigenes TaxID=83661 RepID=A0A1W1VKZ0_DESTI|nr:NADH dehydrogenase subunit A [Desulfonispora thiosulfatigenes DSM 11270]